MIEGNILFLVLILLFYILFLLVFLVSLFILIYFFLFNSALFLETLLFWILRKILT